MQQLKVTIDSYSDAGVKSQNQDACCYHAPSGLALTRKGITAVIADGVNGCEQAAEASRCCVQGFLSDYYSTPDSWQTEHAATRVISALNNWLYSQSMRASEQSSMLSTLSVLIAKSTTAHIFHVGDSRIYRLRAGKLSQITHDHTLSINQQKTYLSRAMGFDLSVHVDYQTLKLKAGDVFLLSTDGVHDTLDNNTLQQQLNQQSSSKSLVQLALQNKAQDNLSALIMVIDELPKQAIAEVFDELTQRPIPPDLTAGMKINGYAVIELINSSSKTQLYLAKDGKSGQKVALKTPSLSFEDDAHYLKHFIYEQWVGQRIHSANVVKIHQTDAPAQFLAYAMEYIEGNTLRQWMQANPKPELDVVLSIVKQIVAGLRAFHRQEMLHCDLKPENIMLDAIGQVKLIDFGATTIAGVAELNSAVYLDDNQGTQGYTAPEVILNRQTSQASDQFSLGAIVYEIFSGWLPYQNKLDSHLTASKLDKLSYTSVLEHAPFVPVWIDGAIAKACSLDKGDRYPALSEFLIDLSQPNPNFLTINHAKTSKLGQKKYQTLAVASVAVNVVLLLLLAL